MEKTYQSAKIETKWADYWERQGFYKPSGIGKPYCIMLPPPNVTGTLHMGHGFQQTLMDALIRYHRMLGHNTLWQGGTDHAGIATQMVVERKLSNEQGISRFDLGRKKFVEKVWEWREESGSAIVHQIRRLGSSIDWGRERFSMDKGISRATREAFIRLYQEGLIYRGQRLVNWDPILGTAISDLEVKNETEKSFLWHIRYPLSDGSGHVIVATTRPETLLGDTAVAVNPNDQRYQQYIGKTIALPLTNRHIPIIADDSIDQTFATGCVKITPGHDFNDYMIGQRHSLPIINILTKKALLNHHCPSAYQNLSITAARKKVLDDLQSLGFIEKTEDHLLSVPRGDRSGAVIQPLLTDQWFLKASILARPAIAAVENGEITFIPENWKNTYLQWLHNIQDWCISRQLWWGHRIPVWYDEQNNMYVGHRETEIRQQYQLPDALPLRRDPDVLDTWFSASLWPFATLGWPKETIELATFFPTNVLVTGFDIIFFWVARMVMMSLKLTSQIPFKQVYVHGLVRDSSGQKMSKSKGNVLDPLDIINGIELPSLLEKRSKGLMQPQMAEAIKKATLKEFPHGIQSFGADALRFTFCALANTGRDINFDLARTEGHRHFCNKLWNAARFVVMNTQQYTYKDIDKNNYNLPDKWINSILQEAIRQVDDHFQTYRFDLLAFTLYEFVWNEYCDWYLELAKCLLNHPSTTDQEKQTTHYHLLQILEIILRLIHPIMPYITEEIWHILKPVLHLSGNSIMQQRYPRRDVKHIDRTAENKIIWLKQVINAIRNIRSETGISPAQPISILVYSENSYDQQCFLECEIYIRSLAKVDNITWSKEKVTIPSAAAVVNDLAIHVPFSGLINKKAEMERLQKEITKLNQEREKSLQKLNNPDYVAKAPQAIVEKERDKLMQSEQTLKKLEAHYAEIISE